MRPFPAVAAAVTLVAAGCTYDEQSTTHMDAQAGMAPCPAFSPDEYARAGEYARLLSQSGAAGVAARNRAERLCLARLGWDAQSFFSSVLETF
jgi:hypothetical protein